MRLRHTCKVATNAAETSIIGCVGCSRGSPHRRYSSVFCVSRSQKKTFLDILLFCLFVLKKLILKSTAGLFEKSCVFLPKNTLERCVACVILYNLHESTRKISHYMRVYSNINIYTEWILKNDRTIERWGCF